jgi:hypothetical protein
MRQRQLLLLLAAVAIGVPSVRSSTKSAAAGAAQLPLTQALFVAQMVELKASDAAVLEASYFAAAKPGPGVLLLHQSNRTQTACNSCGRRHNYLNCSWWPTTTNTLPR